MLLLSRLLQPTRASNNVISIANRITFNSYLQRGYVYIPHSSKYFCTVQNISKVTSNLVDKKSVNSSCAENNLALQEVISNQIISSLMNNTEQKNVNYNDVLHLVNYYKNNDNILNEEMIDLLLKSCLNISVETDNESKLKLAKDIWDLIEFKGHKYTTDMYNLLLQNYIENRHLNIDTHDFLKNMSAPYDEKTLEYLLTLTSYAGDYKQCNDLMTIIKNKNLVINETVFELMILMYCVNKDLAGALQLMEVMKKFKIKPSEKTFDIIVEGLIRLNNPHLIKQTIKSIIFNYKQQLTIVRLFAMKGHVKLAAELLPEVTMKDFDFNQMIIKLLLADKITEADYLLASLGISIVRPGYFLMQLVDANVPPESILRILKCNSFKEQYRIVMKFITEYSFKKKNLSLSVGLIEGMLKNNMPVNISYFWKLLENERDVSGEKGIFEVLNIMKRLNVKLHFTTMFKYVMPYINLDDPVLAFTKISNSSIEGSNVFILFVAYLVEKGMYEEAKTVRQAIPANKVSFTAIKSLIMGYEKTQDLANCALLYQMFLHPEKGNEITESSTAEFLEAVGNYNKNVGENQNFDGAKPFRHFSKFDIMELEFMSNKNTSSKDEHSITRHLLLKYCEQNKVMKAAEMEKKLSLSNYQWTNGLRATLFKVYANNGMVDDAFRQLNDIKKDSNKFQIDDFKIIDFATVLVKKGLIEQCKTLLNDYSFQNRPSLVRNCWKLLDTLSHSEFSKHTNEVLQILIKNGYCKVENTILGPLIRTHLVKEDISSAVNEFKRLAEEYKMTPMKQELLLVLLKKDCNNEFKQVYDICKKINGPTWTNAQVVTCLAQCNKIKELNTIVQKYYILPKCINSCINGLPEEIQASTLNKIIHALSYKARVNLESLYEHLVFILHREGKYEEIEELLNKLETENIQINEEIKDKMRRILKVNVLHIAD